MNFSTAKSERITAIISAVVAVIILAGGVVAYQSHHAPVEDVVQLESDLRFQLEVAFRHDPNERAARLVELTKVSQAWQQSPRSAADQEKLAHWLLEATIRSMPGSIEDLPSVPKFGTATKRPAKQKSADVLVELSPEAKPQESEASAAPTSTTSVLIPAPTRKVPEVAATRQAESADVPEQSPFDEAVTAQSSVVKVAASKPVGINLAELSARIAGYHAGLDDVQAQLRLIGEGDLEAVFAQLDQLAELASDYRFVKLYYDALNASERRTVTGPRSLTATMSAFERKLEQLQTDPSDDFLGEFDTSHQAQVDRLRERLKALTSRVE